MNRKSSILIACFFFLSGVSLEAQENDTTYQFTHIRINPATSVKDQHKSGTCWDFAGLSFIESELIRRGKGKHDLSEMYIVRMVYPEKAAKYIRYHGRFNFSMGGQAHDVTNAIAAYGLVPEQVYPGLLIGEQKHNHGEMDHILRTFCKAVNDKKGGKITPVWMDAYEAVLDAYLGPVPEDFQWQDDTYDPASYAASLEIDPDAYIELTSYSNYPFNEQVVLEIPDNWSDDLYYNVKLDDLVHTMKYALEKGYTLVWDGDVSDRFFCFDEGVAIVPDTDPEEMEKEEREEMCKHPFEQKEITQKIRQEAFDNRTSTDDHLMHITGLVEDQNGVVYFRTKNSWDSSSNDFGGYLNMSEPYIRMHTVAIMLHKDALPEDLAEKLNVK
ncbi:MAG: C1 family peptidase [Bacteroidales bacterium]|nr:C1 family peptidase [Bacteroidales bacterium]MCF8351146.1 C1 family peptidase [Bacteroidales bacterium]MCF8376611.1 C1 family peptidase [Bacteroidales bacterium]MCF8400667.1 C1 family peptidase [Bacteroidales bacterium]